MADTPGIADDDGTPNAVFAYRWLADDEAIGGATLSTYAVLGGDYRLLAQLSVNAWRLLAYEHLLERTWDEKSGDVRTHAHHRKQAGRRRGQPHLHLHRASRWLPDAQGGDCGTTSAVLVLQPPIRRSGAFRLSPELMPGLSGLKPSRHTIAGHQIWSRLSEPTWDRSLVYY